jgi:galactose mutarotase-like enzyme
MDAITLTRGGLIAIINADNQQLVSLKQGDTEYLHGGGKHPDSQTEQDKIGWGNSELVMFPIVGPAHKGVLELDEGAAALGQHGFARHIQWEQVSASDTAVRYRYSHRADAPIRNTKKPSDTEPQTLTWPFPVLLEKLYELTSHGFTAHFTIQNLGTKAMPYMLGWHPAFRVSETAAVKTLDSQGVMETYTLEAIRAASKSGAQTTRSSHATLLSDDRVVHIHTNMPYFMLWSPEGAPFVCIEPVTGLQHPQRKNLHGEHVLQPGQIAHYDVHIHVE